MDWQLLFTTINLIISASVFTFLILTMTVVIIIKKITLKKRLLLLLNEPESIEGIYKGYFTKKRLLSQSRLIEKISLKYGIKLLSICKLNDYWLEKLKSRKNKKLFNRLLTYFPDKALFTCFLIALEKKNYAKSLISWLNESEEFLIMRRIALSGVGEQFSGQKALDLFKDNLPQIREMTGDPEWASRYFSIKILLYDDQDQSIRAIWESFNDSHPLVRKTIASEFKGDDRERLYSELYRLYLNDPVLEVRAAAKRRINEEFTDIYNINIDNLSTPEALHALEHLSPYSKADEDIAINFLDNDNLELRFTAARYLEERGALNRLIEQADLGDSKDMERRRRLLKKSCQVHITTFLETTLKTNSIGSFHLAIDLLSETGDARLIGPLCQKIFSLPKKYAENISLRDKALTCLNLRGTESSLIMLKDLLLKNKYDRVYADQILRSIPERGASIFIGTLLELHCDDKFNSRLELRKALNQFPADLYIQDMLHIIKSGRHEFSHIVRIDSLRVLVELKQSFCLQTILENLPILPLEEAREFARLLMDYDTNEFNSLAQLLFLSDDASVRASLISCLPAVEGISFLKNIKEALNDADPEVRIASIWALVDFKEKKTISLAVEMLRDPVERVRREVAKAISITGSDEALDELEILLNDQNEVDSVKIPTIYGLAWSESLKSIDILCSLLYNSTNFDVELIEALARKTSKKEINHIIEVFKDGSPNLRDKLTKVFTKMKQAGEDILIGLLREEISALKPFICEVLENTGYVESLIRFLKHRDPAKRRKAATELSFIGTESAFRGIVLAARDSDEQVRISVTKALEKLNNPEGTEILKSLREDPDHKVRKYTSWALERINSRAIDD